jgi:TRAP-type C4-dicarboxylate transport system permease small subunit
MMALVLVEVFSRYIMGRPLMVADEFSAYMLVAMSYLAAAYTWRKRGHIRITAFVSRLPLKVADWLRIVALVLALFVTAGLIQSAYSYLRTSFRINMASGSWLHVPLQGPQMTLAIGFGFLALVILIDIFRAIQKMRRGESIEEEHA